MSDGIALAKQLLIAMSDEELAKIEQMLPMIRKVVRAAEDESTSVGLGDLQDESVIDAVVGELDDDLDEYLGREASGQ